MWRQLVPILSVVLLLSSPSSGWAQSEKAIQEFIDEAIKAGGGNVVIPPGVHIIQQGLRIRDGKNLKISGLDRERTILKLAPVASAIVEQDAPEGATSLTVSQPVHLVPGVKLVAKSSAAFTLTVKAVENQTVHLNAPLRASLQAGMILQAASTPHLLEISGASENILLESLTFDGSWEGGGTSHRVPDTPWILLVSGTSDAAKGPLSRIKGVGISRCLIQNVHGGGVQFHAAEGSMVESCSFRDIHGPAVQFSGFTAGSALRHSQIARARTGIILQDAAGCVVQGNDFRWCDKGLDLLKISALAGFNERHRLVDNLFFRVGGNAVSLAPGAGPCLLEDNEVDGAAGHGFVLSGGRHELKNNRWTGVEKAATEP